jgi:hypothetical protein
MPMMESQASDAAQTAESKPWWRRRAQGAAFCPRDQLNAHRRRVVVKVAAVDVCADPSPTLHPSIACGPSLST